MSDKKNGWLLTQWCFHEVQMNNQYETSPVTPDRNVITYKTSLRCYMDLSLSIFSLIAILILLVALIQIILKYFYHRDNIIKIQKLSSRKMSELLVDRGSDVDPYQFNVN